MPVVRLFDLTRNVSNQCPKPIKGCESVKREVSGKENDITCTFAQLRQRIWWNEYYQSTREGGWRFLVNTSEKYTQEK